MTLRIALPKHVPCIQASSVVDIELFPAAAGRADTDIRAVTTDEITTLQPVLNARGDIANQVDHQTEVLNLRNFILSRSAEFANRQLHVGPNFLAVRTDVMHFDASSRARERHHPRGYLNWNLIDRERA